MRFDSMLRLATLGAALFATPTMAQETTIPEHLMGMVGDWRLEQEDQSLPVCSLRFTDAEAIGGWAVELPEPCPAPFPPAGFVRRWNVDEEDGSVLILDAERHVVLRLLEDEDGLFVTPEARPPPST